MYLSLAYDCPFCKEDAEIQCEYDSPSDYYVGNYECARCGHTLDHKTIDKLAFESVPDYISNQIDRGDYFSEI